MPIVFHDSAAPVSEEYLASFEWRIGRRIPPDFRRFLLVHNGGRPEPDTFDILDWRGKPINGSFVQSFFGVNTGTNYNDLGFILDVYRDRLPPSLFPIGDDPGGNLICIETQISSAPIVFWDHEREGIANCVFRVADSFDTFLEQLYEYNPP